MAAGLGFKTFVTGEVLTAADTNGYLMQGVNVFANAAARTAAITSPQEGQMSYLKDTNSTEYYSGAAWVAVGAAGGAYTLLSTTALSGTSTTVTSISGSYTDLIVYIDKVDFNVSAELNFQFNVTANYYNNQLRNGVASYSGGVSKIRLAGSSVQFQGVFLYLPQYTRAFPKNGYAMEFDTNAGAVSWVHFADLNGAAVTQLVVTSQAGTSTMSNGNVYIYGVK